MSDSDDYLLSDAARADYLASELEKKGDPNSLREAARQRQEANGKRAEYKAIKANKSRPTYSGG